MRECGSTGMLARRLQDGLDFIGVDPVGPVVERLRKQLPKSRFEAMGAHEVPAELFRGRVVLINSVIQYFPHEDYLLDFLRAARRGGAVGVFVGDVRCAELLSFQRVAFRQTRAEHELCPALSLFDRAGFASKRVRHAADHRSKPRLDDRDVILHPRAATLRTGTPARRYDALAL